ncbi:HupE/UreJ family protein [Kordia sp.]|uniref:HupE/UreJ family protein n=1 Tax=Kordia sp. TaxID=1965332 RepID=UPI0025B9EF05|nr:HupE/UreJ family protein [Kordia sp.]MCH2195716.1 HupE/UreJ family protein [Kordia sp.]
MSDFWIFFKLGIHHILNIEGLDHILFLVVLIIAYTFNDWKRVLWLVSAFTLGHTLSLLLATYGAVKVNGSIVEFFVLVTIFIMALYNIFTAGKNTNKTKGIVLIISALFFGIIHGLAFAKDFKSMVAAGIDDKLLPLLEFTLGIEVAQIIVVFVVLIISFIFQTIFRFSKRDWIMVVSSIVIGVLIPELIKARFW